MTAPTPEELEQYVRRLFDRVGSFAAVARLTRRQIHDVLFRKMPGDEEGSDVQTADHATELPPMEQDRQALFGVGRMLGVPLEQLIASWREKYGSAPWDVTGG